MTPIGSKSPVGCTGLVLFGFGFLALMAWTGALVGVDSFKSRHLAWLVETLIVGTAGRGLGAVLTAGVGIVLAIAFYALSTQRHERKSSPRGSRSVSSHQKPPKNSISTVQAGKDGTADRMERIRARLETDTAKGAPATTSPIADKPEPSGGFDITDTDDVSRLKAQRDPALWHQAAMAALAYKGDPHGILPWLVQQPEMDRATAGWIFLWAEGSHYLRGATDFNFNSGVRDVAALLRSICERSKGMGFSNDALGLDRDFEAERLKCLAVIENGEMAPGIVAPIALLARPFDPPRDDGRFTLDDGLVICE